MRVWLSAEGAKTFPGPTYLSSEDGVVGLWHLLVNLYWVFFHDISRFKGQEKKGEGISLTTHYHFHPLHRHLDISRAITAESLPLHIASSRTQTRNLIYTYVILIYKYIAYIMPMTFFENFARHLIQRQVRDCLFRGIKRGTWNICLVSQEDFSYWIHLVQKYSDGVRRTVF